MRSGADGHHHEQLLNFGVPGGADHTTRTWRCVSAVLSGTPCRIFALDVRSRLLLLLTSNSGEGFPKVSINASRIAKGMIEDRFHWCP
jgi:hypothetical protein